MDCLIPFLEINIFGIFFIENILSIKELLKCFVLFNGINYFGIFIEIFIKLEKCKE